ncbi:histidine kinase [Ensifer sp. SSB1]|jgi:sensor histidine kinase YesM|uniref:sensor histidine kinase n=1 Tax=Ensifer sp. SSB1 TaxID=2795385 RepID=UPI001A5D612F|nr:histidine kinase [Ensifer sp. SSB1]MBK5570964.1 histidine kinase [Ensifer sp. SSB1]
MKPEDEPKSADESAYVASVRRATLWLGFLYWFVEFLISSILWGILGIDPIMSAPGKLLLMICGMTLSYGIAAAMFSVRHQHIAIKIVVGFATSLVAAFANTGVDFMLYLLILRPDPITVDWTSIGYTLVYSMATFVGWSFFFVALLYSFELRERERRLAITREEALAAQMRALRYQVNPHFLFNTLNSITGLIEEGQTVAATRMVMSLSNFLRTTLELDPLHDVRLADELALQAGYLHIEGERYSDRMKLRMEIASGLEEALVPSLILQPLIENAVKHGVGRSPEQVEIVISAAKVGHALEITVENDIAAEADAVRRQTSSTGIGLKNVADRVQARFPGVGACVSGLVTPRRFRAAITMPLRLA